MLIFIVQAVLFKEFLGPLRLLVFVMNPSTWTDIKRPNSLKMSGLNKIMFSSTSLAPLAIVAMLFKMSIAYQTTMDSVSIILACETAKDAIFDSLVITFIADLDVTMWNLFYSLFWRPSSRPRRRHGDSLHRVSWSELSWSSTRRNLEYRERTTSKTISRCSMIFHLDDFDNFVMKTASHDFVRLARASVFMPAVHRWLRCLRRAEQGRKIESFLAFAIAFVFYARQLTVVLFALDTNVLPSARDVCTLYRWDTGNEETPFMSFGFHVVLRHMLVMDMHKRLVEVGDICQEESFDRMRLPDVKRILGDYPSICVGGMSILLTIFIAPQLIYFVTNRLSDLAKGFSEDEEEEEQENHGLKKQLDRLRRDVDWLLGKRCSSYPYLSSALSPLGVADARAP